MPKSWQQMTTDEKLDSLNNHKAEIRSVQALAAAVGALEARIVWLENELRSLKHPLKM
jgi:hypothetical protein